MSNEEIVAIIGFLTTVFGGIRWLFGVWFKKSAENEKLKQRIYDDAIDRLNESINDLREEFKGLRNDMVEFQIDLKRVTGKYQENQQQGHKVLNALERYMSENEKRLRKIEEDQAILGKVILKNGSHN